MDPERQLVEVEPPSPPSLVEEVGSSNEEESLADDDELQVAISNFERLFGFGLSDGTARPTATAANASPNFMNDIIAQLQNMNILGLGSEDDSLKDSTLRPYLMAEHATQRKYFLLNPQHPCENEVPDNANEETQLEKSTIEPFQELIEEDRVTIEDLIKVQVERTMKGKFFLCRTIMEPIPSEPIKLLVEDPEGKHGLRIIAYNCPDLVNLPKGTILAVRNPFFAMSLIIGDQSQWICVDHGYSIRILARNDILILPQDHEFLGKDDGIKWEGNMNEFEEIVSSQDWMAEGDEHMEKKEFGRAIISYTMGLEREPNNADLFVCRGNAYLNLKLFHRALEDGDISLKKSPELSNGYEIRMKALIGLGHYQEAFDFLSSRKEEFEELFEKSSRLLEQQKSGIYDFEQIWKRASDEDELEGPFDDNIADSYISPSIEITLFGGERGRGVIAKEPIKAGTLLVVNRAFVLDTDLGGNTDSELMDLIDLGIRAEPEWSKDFFKLSAGETLGFLDTGDDEKITIDPERIRNIYNINALKIFTPYLYNYNYTPKLGIWIFPSYFNNDCIDRNCSHLVIGEFMFIRTLKDIGAGEECLLSYKSIDSPDYDYPAFDSFKCKCRLCVAEEMEAASKRDNLLFTLQMGENHGKLGVIEEAIEARLAHANQLELCLMLVPWLYKVGFTHYTNGDYEKAYPLLEKIIELQGELMYESHYAIFGLICLIHCEIKMNPSAFGPVGSGAEGDTNKDKEKEKAIALTIALKDKMMLHFGTSKILPYIDESLDESMKLFGLNQFLIE